MLREHHVVRADFRMIFGFGTTHRLRFLSAGILSYGYSFNWGGLNSLILCGGLSYGVGEYVAEDTASHPPGSVARIVDRRFVISPYDCVGFNLSAKYLVRTRFYGFGMELYCHFHKRTDWGFCISHQLGYLNRKVFGRKRRGYQLD